MCNGRRSINRGHGPKACKLAKRGQGNEAGQNCDHAHDGMAVARNSLDFLDLRGFEHELGPLPGVAGFLALQQRAVLIDPDGREAVPGDAQRKGSFVLVAPLDRRCAVCWDFLSGVH